MCTRNLSLLAVLYSVQSETLRGYADALVETNLGQSISAIIGEGGRCSSNSASAGQDAKNPGMDGLQLVSMSERIDFSRCLYQVLHLGTYYIYASTGNSCPL